jgi:hypothetical protein
LQDVETGEFHGFVVEVLAQKRLQVNYCVIIIIRNKKHKITTPNSMPRGRSTDYTKEELLHFLSIALCVKPISQTAWEMVLAEHNVEFGHKNRTVESFRRKYSQLHRKKIPTGDPECPDE